MHFGSNKSFHLWVLGKWYPVPLSSVTRSCEMRKTQVQFSPLPPSEQGFEPGLPRLAIKPFSHTWILLHLQDILKTLKQKWRSLIWMQLWLNSIQLHQKSLFWKKKNSKLSINKDLPGGQKPAVWRMEKHRQIPFCYTKVSTLQLGLVGYRNIQLKEVWKSWHLLTDELHNANCLAFSLKTYNMPAPDTQFSFKLCSLWRKLNDFKKHLPFTKKCRKRKTLRICAIWESYD